MDKEIGQRGQNIRTRTVRVTMCCISAFLCATAGCSKSADSRSKSPAEVDVQRELVDLRREVSRLSRELTLARDELTTYRDLGAGKSAEKAEGHLALPVVMVPQSEPQRQAARKRVASKSLASLPNSGAAQALIDANEAEQSQEFEATSDFGTEVSNGAQTRSYRLVGGEVQSAEPVIAPVPEVVESKAQVAAPKMTFKTPEKLYEAALAAYRKHDFGPAQQHFSQFLATYPNHDLTDNSAYWLAEIDYARQDYQAALSGFLRVIENYGDGNKVEDSLLKLGFCYVRLGSVDRGHEVFSRLVEMHPDHPAAEIARKELSNTPSQQIHARAKVEYP